MPKSLLILILSITLIGIGKLDNIFFDRTHMDIESSEEVVFYNEEHFISFEFIDDEKVILWSRNQQGKRNEPPKTNFIGEVSYYDKGDSITVKHSCGEYNFSKTALGLYDDKHRLLFTRYSP